MVFLIHTELRCTVNRTSDVHILFVYIVWAWTLRVPLSETQNQHFNYVTLSVNSTERLAHTHDICPTTALQQRQHVATVGCCKPFSGLLFFFDILQIPSGCIQICSEFKVKVRVWTLFGTAACRPIVPLPQWVPLIHLQRRHAPHRHERPLLAKEGTIQGILLAHRNSRRY